MSENFTCTKYFFKNEHFKINFSFETLHTRDHPGNSSGPHGKKHDESVDEKDEETLVEILSNHNHHGHHTHTGQSCQAVKILVLLVELYI